MTVGLLPKTYCQRPTAKNLLPKTYCQRPTAQKPTAKDLLPKTHCPGRTLLALTEPLATLAADVVSIVKARQLISLTVQHVVNGSFNMPLLPEIRCAAMSRPWLNVDGKQSLST